MDFVSPDSFGLGIFTKSKLILGDKSCYVELYLIWTARSRNQTWTLRRLSEKLARGGGGSLSIMQNGQAQRRHARALEILERHEAKAAIESELNEGVLEMLEVVSKKKLKKALLTRNSRKSVDTVLRKHDLHLHFEFIVSREDSKPKPAPDPIFLLSKE